MCPSPGLGDLLVWDGRPHRLAVALLFELSAERLFDVVHVEGADGRTGDAAEEMRRGSNTAGFLPQHVCLRSVNILLQPMVLAC